MMLEVRAAELAAERRTDADLTALDRALAARDAAFAAPAIEPFIDADIALHTAVTAAAHNPILADLFAEFVPVLREGLLDLVTLVDVRTSDSAHGRPAHAALIEAIRTGDPTAAGQIIKTELTDTLAALLQGS